MEKYILSLDQGTTSSRAIVFNHKGENISTAQREFTQFFPKEGWVEHDPNEIWYSQASVAAEAITKIGLNGKNIAGIGITNQRETTIVWDKETGMPLYNAIVWQDRRTAAYCDSLKEQGLTGMIQEKTGLVLDAYFSATKIKWILDNIDGARARAEKGKLAFGTVDCWLIWKFTNMEKHITDVSNASRTMLFNINTLQWDEDLLKLFDIPKSMMPEVKSSSEVYGETKSTLFASKVPLAGIAGDQQAALFGQMCLDKGMAKNTYGTGCFMMLNTGNKPVLSKNNLLTTIGWKINGKVTYALEGSVFIGGAVIQWLRDGLEVIKNSKDSEKMALEVDDNGGVYFVPALTGLGAPHWDQYARGAILGINRGTKVQHIVRAALEGIAFQVKDVMNCMVSDTGIQPEELRVDGGAVANNMLMQFQADIFGFKVVRPHILETTALGAAYLAGLAVGYWDSVEELKSYWHEDNVFAPSMKQEKADELYKYWHKALDRSKNWVE
ncbi:glycerol kinase GlpK [Aureibacter tunicatorum]|uniref:Glycerol kinase n=1 Tax=Aureibacter tunicatorum TaxID=866807 RepID=A0AAE4BUX3_9BACT|nr:glycerol kinase GlpK [Aureibacter tunicatorum]MDR6241213.1 glycerol kinase [Aureibacter tunicatorum]BDD03474.1 glycerol kinase [Aureibacter tunicatorum]